MGDQVKVKRKRVYMPYIGIKEAIDRLAKLKARDGFTEVSYDIALIGMGYTPSSSSADRVLSALLSYGLLDQRGASKNKIVWMTSLAKQILLSLDDD
jgi:hypothetical protein